MSNDDPHLIAHAPNAKRQMRTPVLIRHQGLRRVSQEEVVAALGGLGALDGIPIDFEVDTNSSAENINDGNWVQALGTVWQKANELRATANNLHSPRLVYAGALPEVALSTAFGAYLGDTHHLETLQLHDDGSWVWPNREQSLQLVAEGTPHERVSTSGAAILRVEIAAKVLDEHVRSFVESGTEIAEIRVVPAKGPSKRGLVQSQADVEEVRRAVRAAIASLIEFRPRLKAIHLFIAAPPAACVVTGQELGLRNNVPVQTYRHRQTDGVRVMVEAVRLQFDGPTTIELPLTEQQATHALELQDSLWRPALRDLEVYARRKAREGAPSRTAGQAQRWYDGLLLGREFGRLSPFPTLPAVQSVVERPATLDGIPAESRFFAFLPETKQWNVNPRFSIRLEERFPDANDAHALVRIFLFHEYLHTVHGITKATADEVGKFANGLEYADYMCDLYGILHELDFEFDSGPELERDFEILKARIGHLIDLVIRSFWAFEDRTTRSEMEYRRMRRYMNWYWQQVRVRRSESSQQLAAVLARKPIVEVAGLASRAEGRRHYGSLQRLDDAVGLEIGILLDSEQLLRIPTGPITPLHELLAAFRIGDHSAIQQVFRQLYENASQTGHALPAPTVWE